MSNITKTTVTVYPPDEENFLQEPRIGEFFLTFVKDQKLGSGEQQFIGETNAIMAHCNPSVSEGIVKPVVHLALGYVQSGKTMSFTGLTALALDNNYKMIVYLAGVTNNLLEQTAERLQNDLIKKHPKHKTNYKIYKNPQKKDEGNIINDINCPCQRILLLPVLKENDRISKLVDLLQSPSMQNTLRGKGVIIVDDEADQVSLNGLARINSRRGTNDKTATYRSILDVIAALPGCSYVQYTATPQANLLMDITDILSPRSHTVLTPGSAYIGGKHFFGFSPSKDMKAEPFPSLYGGKLVCKIPNAEVFDTANEDTTWTALPQSLKKALKMHIIATAIVVSWRGDKEQDSESSKKPEELLSMLIHVDRSIPWNQKIHAWVKEEMSSYQNFFNESPDSLRFQNIYKAFEELYKDAIEFYKEGDAPSFEELVSHIKNMLNDHYVHLVNSHKDADKITKDTWGAHSMHILVGADMLNRGFTVEKLATTYMSRHTRSTPNADTVEQRCRFFGYKMNYIESCRVFLNEEAINYYKDYVNSEEEMRDYLKRFNKLEDISRLIMMNPSLRPTRNNVLPAEVTSTILRGSITFWGMENDNFIKMNWEHVNSFIKEHPYSKGSDKEYIFHNRSPHRGFEVSVDTAIKFIKDFMVTSDMPNRYGVIRLLEDLDPKKTNIHFVEMDANFMSKETDDEPVRTRRCNPLTMKTDAGLQVGHSPNIPKNSPNYYPGDALIVNSEEITFQLYRFRIHDGNEKWPANRPDSIASLVVVIPEKYRTRIIK